MPVLLFRGDARLSDGKIKAPTDPAFVAEAIQVMEGSAQALKDWAFLVESMKGLSESIADLIPGQYLQVVNPANEDLSLLILLDGYVYYNFADE